MATATSKPTPIKNTVGDPHFPQSGAILIDKPAGITSTDVVFKLKKSLSAGLRLPWGFKIGHGGTLDPFATGLMVVFYGEATKLANTYLRSRKSYTGRIRLGTQTDSADYTGTVIAEAAVPALSLADWQALANKFVSTDYLQTPPMYSAKKKDGVALYHLAREGREIEREAVLKRIFEFTLTAPSAPDLEFKIDCDSGTYVRTIAEDLAKAAGTHAHLLSLHRTVSSDFEVGQSSSLAAATELLASDTHASNISCLVPVTDVAKHLPFIAITAQQEQQLRRGHTLVAKELLDRFQEANPAAVYGLLRGEDRFPVGLIHEFKLQRILNRI